MPGLRLLNANAVVATAGGSQETARVEFKSRRVRECIASALSARMYVSYPRENSAGRPAER